MILSEEEFKPAYEEARRTAYRSNSLAEYSKEELMALFVIENRRTSGVLAESHRSTDFVLSLL